METLGISFLLLSSVVSAFTLILRSVSKLNEHRDRILGIADAPPLSREHQEMYLYNNFRHLRNGTICFCIVLNLFVALLPYTSTTDRRITVHVASWAIFIFVASATYSIWKTCDKDYRRMRSLLESSNAPLS